jgi:glutathione S-transferase
MAYTVLGSAISPFVRKVMVCLREKNVAFEHEDVNPFAPPPGWRAVSPLGRIPALRHGERIVNDSSVICRYIEQCEPQPPLYPREPYECARAEWIEEYMDGGLQPVAGNKVFLPRVLGPLLGRGEPDEAAVEKALDEEVAPLLDYLESQLTGDYFVGDALSIADVAIGSGFVNMRLAGVVPDAKRHPKLRAFVKRMHTRPSFAGVIGPIVDMIGKRWVALE